MIKFSGTRPNGRKLIVLGLSEINVTKMREGLPIHIHADELGFDGEIVIVVGPTEDALAEKFLALIPGLEVTDHRNERKLLRFGLINSSGDVIMPLVSRLEDLSPQEGDQVVLWTAVMTDHRNERKN